MPQLRNTRFSRFALPNNILAMASAPSSSTPHPLRSKLSSITHPESCWHAASHPDAPMSPFPLRLTLFNRLLLTDDSTSRSSCQSKTTLACPVYHWIRPNLRQDVKGDKFKTKFATKLGTRHRMELGATRKWQVDPPRWSSSCARGRVK